MSHFIDHEPSPIPNGSKPIWDLVIDDMRERDLVGRQRYGTPLQAHNGRRPLVDSYQECLDLVVYLRQEIEERAALEHRVDALGQAIGAFRVAAEALLPILRDHFDGTAKQNLVDQLEEALRGAS